MPIHAPTLPPRPLQGEGLAPALVLARFEVRRILRQRLGRFFGFAFALVLLVDLALVYFKPMAGVAGQLLPQGAAFQAGLLGKVLLFLLWLQVAQVGGGLVARDTLYRIRPLMYAHPVRHLDYLLGKGLVAVGLPFLILLPFILLPWGVSLLMAGAQGPVWPTAPLHLIPAALVVSFLMGILTLGASSLASTPGGGFAWALGGGAGLRRPGNASLWAHGESGLVRREPHGPGPGLAPDPLWGLRGAGLDRHRPGHLGAPEFLAWGGGPSHPAEGGVGMITLDRASLRYGGHPGALPHELQPAHGRGHYRAPGAQRGGEVLPPSAPMRPASPIWRGGSGLRGGALSQSGCAGSYWHGARRGPFSCGAPGGPMAEDDGKAFGAGWD